MKRMKFSSDCLILLFLFILSISIRFAWIGRYIGQDEIYYVGYSTDIIHGRPFTNVFPPFFELILAPILILSGESELAVHIFMAFLGAINVILLYLVGKEFFNKWVGLIAALLLCFNTTHWFFSDFGMLDVPNTLFVLAGLYFYWLGYKKKSDKHLLLGMLFSCFAVGTRYGFFPSVAFIGYLLFFDRKNLKNLKLMRYFIIPLIFFAIWMLYYVTQVRWLWDWWYSYITGQLEFKEPFYRYFQNIYEEFLLPLPTFFTLFSSLLLLVKRYTKLNEKILQFVFLSLFLVFSVYFMFYFYSTQEQYVVIGFLTLAFLSIYHFKGSDFNKYLIFFMLSVFAFYSPLGVKFPRYVMLALPALYLLVGKTMYDLRKLKLYLIASTAVLLIFIVLNSSDTITKLRTDIAINEVKHEAQAYVNENSENCSPVYSKGWYGFYYLRLRINDLPESVDDLKSMTGSRCNCPPKYVIFEGFIPEAYANESYFGQEQYYSAYITTTKLDFYGYRTEKVEISPVYVYRIKDSLINEVCG
jgi:4-amino-4-deoxy-L-arabinose transferase-like glycosyltransferase